MYNNNGYQIYATTEVLRQSETDGHFLPNQI